MKWNLKHSSSLKHEEWDFTFLAMCVPVPEWGKKAEWGAHHHTHTHGVFHNNRCSQLARHPPTSQTVGTVTALQIQLYRFGRRMYLRVVLDIQCRMQTSWQIAKNWDWVAAEVLILNPACFVVFNTAYTGLITPSLGCPLPTAFEKLPAGQLN